MLSVIISMVDLSKSVVQRPSKLLYSCAVSVSTKGFGITLQQSKSTHSLK